MDASSFKDWVTAGEMLYSQALTEYQDLEAQLQCVEQLLVTKRTELNRIAQLIGKPPLESNHRLNAQLVDPAASAAPIVSQVTRAFNGRGLGRG